MAGGVLRFIVPEPAEAYDVVMDDGAVIRLRRHGNTDAPRVILSHGNGCAVDGYFPFWRLLLRDFEVVAFDFRHYGQNPPHDGVHDFDRFLLDMTAVYDAIDREFGPKPQLGAFHSMSARTNLRYALEVGWRLDGLVVFDPPMVPPEGHALHKDMIALERLLWRWAEDRPSRFDDPSELAEHFSGSRMLSGWVDGAYDLMARAVLRRDGDAWTLSCPGSLEADIYRQNAALRMWPQADAFPGPVMIVASDPESGSPPGRAALALRDECGWRYECVRGSGHFLQIEQPEACAELVYASMTETGSA